MSKNEEINKCETCDHEFGMGEKIYILHISIHALDVCEACKDRVMDFIESMKTDKPIMVSNYEAMDNN